MQKKKTGGMTLSQYRSEFSLWVILGSPLIFGATLPQLLENKNILNLITNKEMIAINQDITCVQGSMLRMQNDWEIWGKPLFDSSIVILILNKNNMNSMNVTIEMFGYHSDLYPMFINVNENNNNNTFQARDVINQTELGIFISNITLVIQLMDVRVIKVYDFQIHSQ